MSITRENALLKGDMRYEKELSEVLNWKKRGLRLTHKDYAEGNAYEENRRILTINEVLHTMQEFLDSDCQDIEAARLMMRGMIGKLEYQIKRSTATYEITNVLQRIRKGDFDEEDVELMADRLIEASKEFDR